MFYWTGGQAPSYFLTSKWSLLVNSLNLQTGRPFILQHTLVYPRPSVLQNTREQLCDKPLVYTQKVHQPNRLSQKQERAVKEAGLVCLALLTFQCSSWQMKKVMLTDAFLYQHHPHSVQHLINLSDPMKQHYPSHILLSLASLFELLFFANPKY